MSGVGPDDRVVERFSSLAVPNYRGLSLVGDANCFDWSGRVALGLKGFHGAFNTFFNGSDDFKRIMFMPSVFIQYRAYNSCGVSITLDEDSIA